MGRRFGFLWLVAVCTAGPARAVDLPAELDWSRRAALAVPVTGVVREVAVRPGQRVAKGDLLVALDDRLPVARLAQAEAALRQARNDRAEARRELDRALKMFEQTLLSEHERQEAEIAAAAAEAAYQRAHLALTAAQLMLEYSHLRAPFAGIVVEVRVLAGETVVSALKASPLVILADDQQMVAVARVTAEQARRWPVGTSARVTVGGEWYDGKVIQAGLEPLAGDAKPPHYALSVVFQRPAERDLRAGEAGEVHIGE